MGRFIVYYYRFAPSQKDKPWDIGVVISIVEPSVAIIAACAPAMKCLFRHLMPRYFSEDGSSYQTQEGRTKPKSAHSRSLSLRYHMGKETGDDRGKAMGREEEVYGMRPLASVDSTDEFVNTALSGHGPTRTRSMKTGYSASVEAEPKHFLNHEK